MATTNNSKSFFDLSVTTQLFLLVGFLWKVQLLLIFNPLTLFVLNIFKPRWARSMAHSDALYDKKSQEFFTEQAKKWPWHWAKWWYTSKEIGCLTDDKLLDYYYNVSHSIETLNAMSIHDSAKVIGKDFEAFKKGIANINMSYNLFCAFIRASIEKDDMSALGDYLKRGTLPKDQVKILSEYASDSTSGIYSNTWLALVFYDYVERCGLGKELFKTILERPSSAKFKAEVEKRLDAYNLRVCKYATKYLS